MKGITPVISVILLLLIAIAMVGFAFGFFQRIGPTTSTEGEKGARSVINFTTQSIRIDNAKSGAVAIRNTGSATVLLSSLAAYVNTSQTYSSVTPCGAPIEISPGGLAVCPLTCTTGSTLRIVSSGGEDRATCI